ITSVWPSRLTSATATPSERNSRSSVIFLNRTSLGRFCAPAPARSFCGACKVAKAKPSARTPQTQRRVSVFFIRHSPGNDSDCELVRNIYRLYLYSASFFGQYRARKQAALAEDQPLAYPRRCPGSTVCFRRRFVSAVGVKKRKTKFAKQTKPAAM